MADRRDMLTKYSFGMGDRFAHQAKTQLKAIQKAKKKGVHITPVWNKSFREHQIIGSESMTTRIQADLAVQELGWEDSYLLDADHINLSNVDFFMGTCDFFTLDVADYIGKPADANVVKDFVEKNKKYCGKLALPGLDLSFEITEELIQSVAEKYLFAVQQAAEIHAHISRTKSPETFVIEVSMDETDEPQTPVEMLLILAMIAKEGIPIDTIAPKFSGRFNKGVDYVGDVAQFEKEFEQDVLVLKYAAEHFGLKESLRLSVHSGSDKFAIYPGINRIIRRHGIGLHVKTAGTTWLEEVIGLAEAGGSGLAVAKKVYAAALGRYDELAAPYATVIDIDPAQLPSVEAVDAWSSIEYVKALRHDQSCPDYNPGFRQLIHVAYKVAYELGDEYLSALDEHRETVARNVTKNLLERHLLPLFGAESE